MRTITQTYDVYTIEDHPDPEKVYEWIRYNWHDLADHTLQEALDSVQAFSKRLGITVDWSLGATPHRSEYITFYCDFGDELARNEEGLSEWLKSSCPFTGTWADEVILDAFREAASADTLDEVLEDVASRIITAVHTDAEYIYSDIALHELCEANEYEFTSNGKVH